MPKMKNLFKSAHVKKSTAGTSNELSFSVLDAAKQAMDEKHGEARRVQQLGKIDLFSGEREPGHNVLTSTPAKAIEEQPPIASGKTSNSDSESGESPAQNRDTASSSNSAPTNKLAGLPLGMMSALGQGGLRKKGIDARRGFPFVAIAVVVAIVVAFAVIGISGYMSQRSGFSTAVAETLEIIGESDAPIVRMNDLLAEPSSEESKAHIGEVIDGLNSAEQALARANESVVAVEGIAATASEHETAARLSKDVAGRQAMISNGRMILSYLQTAQSAMASIDEAWALVGSSNDSAYLAANAISSSQNADSALSYIRESTGYLADAAEKVDEAAELYPSADLTAIKTYLEYEMAAIEKEAEAIQAIKNLDGATARAKQAEYEELDAKAQQALAEIDDVDKPIIDAYQVIAADFITKYEAARTEVALSDEYLRDFLGRANK